MNGKILAKLICLTGFFGWAWLLIHKYYSLGYYDWDFAFFAQAMWSLGHGSCYVSLFDINFFSNHANLIALILVPLYKIFPHPLTLLMLKLASFSIASYILYLLAEEKLGRSMALMVLCLFWLYPPNINGLAYEFDFENLAPAFIMLTYYFYSKEKWVPFMISSLFLITIKENMPLIIAAFGVHGLLTKSNKFYWGLIPTLLGGFSFYVLAFIFVPLMGGHTLGQHPYDVHYSDLNPGLLMHPLAWKHLITFNRTQWLGNLFFPLPLSLISPGTLFLVSPVILQHFLSNVRQEHTTHYGYTLTIIPFIFLALINALGRVKKKFSKGKLYLIFLVSMISCLIYLCSQMDLLKDRYMAPRAPLTADFGWRLLKMVPPQVPVIASFRFLPELSQRPFLYSFYKAYSPAFQNEHYSYKFPANIHYALIDFNEGWFLWSFHNQRQITKSNVRKFLFQGAWKIKYASTNIYLLER